MIRISDTKLKVILSRSDLQELDLDVETMDYGNVSTKRVFWEILDKARHITGFDVERAKLYVQVFPDAEGGCEMFITKYESEAPKDGMQAVKKVYRLALNATPEETGVYVRLGFDALCGLCKRMKREGVRCAADLYHDCEGGYILALQPRRRLPAYISARQKEEHGLPAWLCEYGDTGKLDGRGVCYLAEHYEKLACENAVELIANL